jgi:hypothetical protein
MVWRLIKLLFPRRRRPSPPPAQTRSWEYPPEAAGLPVRELVARDMAMGYAYAMLSQMGLVTGDAQRDFDTAWAIGGRLRDLHLESLRRGAEQS